MSRTALNPYTKRVLSSFMAAGAGILVAAVLVLALTLGARNASATPISPEACVPTLGADTSTADHCLIRLDVGNSDLTNPGFTGPYTSGYINWVNGHTIQIHMQSDTQTINGTPYEYKFGNLFMNLANYPTTGISLSLSGVTDSGGNSQTGYTLGTPSGGALGVFGSMDSGLSDHNGWGAAVTSLTFTLTASGANSANFWTDAASVLARDSSGSSFEAHVYVANATNPAYLGSLGPLGQYLPTGYAGWPCAGEPTCVSGRLPEPKPLALLGASLIGLAILRQRYYGKI